MSSPAIECRDLACGYAGKVVLSGINLQVFPGESVALLGPNGSGKSTLLKTLTKTAEILGGAASIAGRDIARISHLELARLIGFVPQDEVIHFPFSVRDMVTMGRLPASQGLADSAEDRQAATDAMALSDCLALADRPMTELSGGEKQRVLIARALAQDTPILLLDEPTAHLDISHQLGISKLTRALSEQGKCVVAAVHDLNLAASFGTRAIVLRQGQIALDAPMQEALESDILDEVYEVRFERMRLDSGRLALFADYFWSSGS